MRVGDMALHANAERLDALQQLKGIGRRQAGAEIAQALGARPHDERGRSELLVEDDAVIAGIGFGQHRKFAGRAPVEPAAVDDHAADRDAVAADPFGGRIHHDVGAEFDRPAEIRRGEGVVDQQRDLCVMRDCRDGRNIQHFKSGIADGLADHEPRVGPDRGAELVQRARLDKGGGNAEARQGVREKVDGAAIERGGGDDVVAGVEQGRDRQMQRRHAARGADGADAAFQRGKPLFEHRRGRVRNPRIDVAGAFEIEQRRGVIGILKDVGCGLIDRDRARARDGIGVLAGVQAQGLEGGRLGCGHGDLERRCGWAGLACRTMCHKNSSIVSPLVGAAPLSCWPRPALAKIILSIKRPVVRLFACHHAASDGRNSKRISVHVEWFCLIYD